MTDSERLTARIWSVTDLPHARKIWGDSEVMRYIDARGGLAGDLLEERMFAEIGLQQEFGAQYWPWFERKTGDFVGCCGVKPWVHSRREGWELGFYLAREKWGRGYAQEMSRAVIQYAQEKEIGPLLAGHHPENEPSRKILQGLGFDFVEFILFKPTGLQHPSYILKA